VRRATCSSCESGVMVKFLDLGKSPVADAYAETKAESLNLERYPLEVAVCTGCWLVQLLEVLPQEQLFGTGYHFYSSASPPLVDYHRRYAEAVLQREEFAATTGLILEVGCNDGDMLQHFVRVGRRVIGVDPALGPAGVARERGLDVRIRPFGKAFAQDLLDQNGPASIIIANHVLAHVEDVHDFLSGISLMLAPGGVAYVEVQYLPDLLVNNAFDLVYHEHRNFFSFTSLERAAARVGLVVRAMSLTERQGGSLRVELVHRFDHTASDWTWLHESERWLTTVAAYEGFQGRVDRIKVRLNEMLFRLEVTSKVVAGFGAPAKATTLLNFLGWTPAWVVDTTEAKQRRYVPGTTAQIISQIDETHPPDVYVLLAWNYAAEIMRQRWSYRGRWILPIPAPVML
jgi:SAM-dependent methyltransferase